MAHGHAHEEAEHAAHHAHDPFDRRVAMSMVVIAAVLATVKVIGHRTHNETLGNQIRSGVAHTQESDQWNFFQSKKMREVLARQEAKLLLQLASPGKDGPVPTPGPLPDRDKRLATYSKELKELLGDSAPKEAERIVASGEKHYQALLAQRYPPAQAERVVDAEMTADRYNTESKAIVAKANDKKADAEKYTEASVHKHHQADYFDLGELGVELALVLSSVAILTKRSSYWYGGLFLGLVGLVFVVLGYFAH